MTAADLGRTPCEKCDNVHSDTRKWEPRNWRCVKFPRLPGMSPVAPTQGVGHPPFQRCEGINGGYCPLWTARRDHSTGEA